MPAFNGEAAPGQEPMLDEDMMMKKRSVADIASGITTALLILIVTFFTCGSLWLGIFAIPAFFAFFRASVVTVSSVREGVNQLEARLQVTRPLPFQSLKLGAACGLILTFLAGGLTIFALELIESAFLADNDDARAAYRGVFRIFGAIVFTHLGVSVLQQGGNLVRSSTLYETKIKKFAAATKAATSGPDRGQLFYLGLAASLREGIVSYLFMIPLGGAFEAENIPLPAVLGAIAGLLAARYLAPALVWGGVGESDGIRPDSQATSWSTRREALTNQYVSRLAAKAQDAAAAASDIASADGGGGAGAGERESKERHDSGAGGVPKNLTDLTAGALEEMFRDSEVDPENYNDLDYAQKRLLVLKSSKALRKFTGDGGGDGGGDGDGDEGSDGDSGEYEAAVHALQSSSQWGSMITPDVGRQAPEKNTVGSQLAGGAIGHRQSSRSMGGGGVHRKGKSLISIAEDQDGYTDRGGYMDGEEETKSDICHLRKKSAMKGSGHARNMSAGTDLSVRFANDSDDDASSIMEGFQHKYLRQAGPRDPKAELEVMEAALSHSVIAKKNRSIHSLQDLRPGSPNSRAAAAHRSASSVGSHFIDMAPDQHDYNHNSDADDDDDDDDDNDMGDLEASVGGNLALGSTSKRSRRRRTSSARPLGRSGRSGSSRKHGRRGSSGVGVGRGFGRRVRPGSSVSSGIGSGGSRKTGGSYDDYDDEDSEYARENAFLEDMAERSFFATIALSISAFVIFLCCAGLLKLGVLDIKSLFTDLDSTVFDICGCCEPKQDGSVREAFFSIFNDQIGYTCEETFIGILAWGAYWVYPILVTLFAMRMLCFSSIRKRHVPRMITLQERRTAGEVAAAATASAGGAGSMRRSTRRFLGGEVPDPARIRHHPTHFWIKLSALLNIGAGSAYIWWRASRSMPEDPIVPVWNWLFFAGEVILTVGVWTSHLQRAFPSIRDLCTMDDLIEIDSNVANEATVCIMVPTAGEKMKNLKHVLLGAYSQRLWPSTMHANRQLRIAVLDEKGRREVRDLVGKVYRLAESLVVPSVQLELCSKFNEPFISPKIFMDYFNQMDALDKYMFGEACHPAFDIALRIENYTGVTMKNKLNKGSSSSALTSRSKAKNKKTAPPRRLKEGFKELFNTSHKIPSIIYSARASPGTPKVSPKAGNMNAAIFPNSPGEEPVIGDAARIVVVNDARHRLKTEFLQRTVPYFFKLNRRTAKNYSWADVGFVQTPQRFEDLGDGDPLGNHAVLTFFVSNVSKDGVGGVSSCGQGSLWRVDALRGLAADGTQTVDSVKSPDIIGHDCGFRSEVLIEDTHTSLEFFKQQWRSAYVCEPGETLAVCVEQPNTVAWRVKQVFRWHIGAVQLLLKDGPCFVCTSKMPTPFHKMFGLDSLTYYIQAVGGFFIILMPIMFSIFQETPFNTVDLEFIYFFFPYIITATIPTILAVGWKNVNPNRVLTDEQFWLSTCYVQIWAFALGIWNRITCANPDNAWNLVCPVWPLGLLFCLLMVSAINTTIYWMYYLEFDQDGMWIFLASFGACLVVMYSIWPMVKLWWPGWIALPSAYHQKFCYILIFIALTSVLATFL